MTNVTILCNNPSHPVIPFLKKWAATHEGSSDVALIHDVAEVASGDFLFLISCSQIVKPVVRERFKHVLVVHASDLPEGRGWSPQAWSVLRGDDHLTVSLLEAADPFDTGRIWHKARVDIEASDLFGDIHDRLFQCTTELMDWALANAAQVEPREQEGDPTYWPKREPADSRLDPDKSISEQFDLIRIADPDRFPAFFDLRGQRYLVRLEKASSDECE